MAWLNCLRKEAITSDSKQVATQARKILIEAAKRRCLSVVSLSEGVKSDGGLPSMTARSGAMPFGSALARQPGPA